MSKLNFKNIQHRLTSAAGLVAGSVAGSYAGTALEKVGNGKISPTVSAGIRIVAAAALPAVLGHGKKEGFITDFSNGMMAQAGVSLAAALKVPGVHGVDTGESLNGWAVEDGMHGVDTGGAVSGTSL